MPRVCIYTAIYGGYDELKPAVAQGIPCDFVCFTDNPGLRNPGGWRVVHAPDFADRHPRMRAKFFKLMHHRVFRHGRIAYRASWIRRRLLGPRYAATIWIDGSLKLKSRDFAEEFTARIGPAGWAMLAHPDRTCIYAEADVSVNMEKYASQAIAEQVAAYRAEGYPADNGLFACGAIARSASADLEAIEKAWWDENNTWTYQDQLSLPVVLWRLGRGVDLAGKDLWSNDWFDWVQHKSLA